IGAQRRDDDIRPKSRAVLANAPVFVLEPAERRRLLELVLGPASRDLLLGIEPREMGADDLRCLVALHGSSAFGPRPDAAARVEHENRIVARRLDEPAIDVVGEAALGRSGMAVARLVGRHLTRAAI